MNKIKRISLVISLGFILLISIYIVIEPIVIEQNKLSQLNKYCTIQNKHLTKNISTFFRIEEIAREGLIKCKYLHNGQEYNLEKVLDKKKHLVVFLHQNMCYSCLKECIDDLCKHKLSKIIMLAPISSKRFVKTFLLTNKYSFNVAYYNDNDCANYTEITSPFCFVTDGVVLSYFMPLLKNSPSINKKYFESVKLLLERL